MKKKIKIKETISPVDLFIILILFLNSSCVNLLMGLESWKWPLENGYCGQHMQVERGGCGALSDPRTQNHTITPCCWDVMLLDVPLCPLHP